MPIRQKAAFRSMKSRSGSRPIVGSGGGSVSWLAIMSSGLIRSGSFRNRFDAAGLSWSATCPVSTMVVTSRTVWGLRSPPNKLGAMRLLRIQATPPSRDRDQSPLASEVAGNWASSPTPSA